MKKKNARNVTHLTKQTFYHSIKGIQHYYWWELPDKTVIAVLLIGPSIDKLYVAVVETSPPGIGLEGIKNWRSHDLRRESSLSKRPRKATANK